MLARAVAALIAVPALAAAALAPGTAGSGTPLSAACGAAGYPAGYGIWCPGRIRLVTGGDSLWALSRRYLGNGRLWPEIWILGSRVPRPCGSSASPPGQIHPGEILIIPAAGQAGAPPWCQPGTWQPAPGVAASPAPARSSAVAAPARGAPVSKVLLGAAAAAVLAAGAALAMAARRRDTGRAGPQASGLPRALVRGIAGRRRRRDRRGLRRPGRPPAGPWMHDGGDIAAQACPPGRQERPGRLAASPGLPGTQRRIWSPVLGTGEPDAVRPPGQLPVGIRDHHEATAGIAALGGLGLTGPGAEAAARAILATVLSLTRPSPPGQPAPVIVPAGTGLLPSRAAAPPTLLAQPPSLAAALDLAEALLLHVTRLAEDGEQDTEPAGPPVPAALFAVPGPGDEARLRGVAAAGHGLGLIVVVLGPWPDGVTCDVAADGTVTTVTPPGTELDGVRLFQLAARDLAAVAAAIGETRPGNAPVTAAADPTHHQALARSGDPRVRPGQRRGIAHPRRPVRARQARLAALDLMSGAQHLVLAPGPFAPGDPAAPPEDRMITGERDDVTAQQRVEPGPADQRR